MMYSFSCTCGEDQEIDITVTYGGSSGSFGLPETSYPPEGAEWHVDKDIICEGCGRKWDNTSMSEKFEDDIQQQIAEAHYDRGEEDYEG